MPGITVITKTHNFCKSEGLLRLLSSGLTLVHRYQQMEAADFSKFWNLSTTLYSIRPQKTYQNIHHYENLKPMKQCSFHSLYLSVSSYDGTKENQHIYFCYDAE